MPILDIQSQIDRAKDIEDLRPVLRTLVQTLNALADGRHRVIGSDSIVGDPSKGFVSRGDDGKWYRAKVANSNGTISFTFEDLGLVEPQ